MSIGEINFFLFYGLQSISLFANRKSPTDVFRFAAIVHACSRPPASLNWHGMNDAETYIAPAVVGYLLGSIPTGYLLAKSRGLDIRSVGSGSTGATNVTRGLGKGAGIAVLVIDILKGMVAVLFVAAGSESGHIGPFFFGITPEYIWAAVIAGTAAVAGHNFPIWLKFRGGKGVATSLGVFLVLAPTATICALMVWGLAFVILRYVSVASMLAAISLPLWVVLFPNRHITWLVNISPKPIVIATAFLAALLIVRHKDNIARLLVGTEPKFRFKKKGSPTTESKS